MSPERGVAASEPFRWLVLAGGLSPYTLELWDQVAGVPGHEVKLCHVPRTSNSALRHEQGQLAPSAVQIHPVTGFGAAARVARLALRWGPRVVICMGYYAGYNAVLAALFRVLGSRALVVYMSDTNAIELLDRLASGPSASLLFQLKRAIIGRVFTTSFDLGPTNAAAHRMLGISTQVELPLLAVQDPALAPNPSDRFAAAPSAPSSPRLVCVARLDPVKNVLALARAWRRHVAAGRAGSLTWVGDGPLLAEIEAVAQSLPPGRMVVRGAVPFRDARGLMRGYDGSVLVSTYEPWGIVVVESLMAGVPVLATRRVGAAWSLADLAPGAILFGDADEGALVEALERFVQELPQRQVAARTSAPKLRARFAVDAVARRLVGGADAWRALGSNEAPLERLVQLWGRA